MTRPAVLVPLLAGPGLRRLAQDALARNSLLSPAAPLLSAPRLPGPAAARGFDGRKS